MAIYFHWTQATQDLWNTAFETAGAGSDIRREGNIGNPDDIEYAGLGTACRSAERVQKPKVHFLDRSRGNSHNAGPRHALECPNRATS